MCPTCDVALQPEGDGGHHARCANCNGIWISEASLRDYILRCLREHKIDNALDLPPTVDTFGYQTARHVGVGIVKNIMVDAKTTGRWYFIITMGRKTGHLALGIGKSAGVTLTLVPEEFEPGPIRLNGLEWVAKDES